MSFIVQRCGICNGGDAAVFMVIRQSVKGGLERIAKEHVCLNCFEGAQERLGDCVESVSLPEFREAGETQQQAVA